MSRTTAPRAGAPLSTPRGNARATVRYRCAPATIGKVYLGDDHEYQHAWVLNLSVTGIGLSLPRPIPAGSEATIQIRGNDGKTYDLYTRIVHCTEQPHHDWSVGGEFVQPLTADDLDNLL